MSFVRVESENWHRDVPGARWFKTDLHVHTVDDLAGGKAKFPSDINGPVDSEETIRAYARKLLQSAVERDVRVLGLTPHSPTIDRSTNLSAVWYIVEEWNAGVDDDGRPFREKIYAVFPGFEPSFNQGKSGLHLLFLFDPEIGYDSYILAFNMTMGIESSPWRKNELQLSSVSAEQAFQTLNEFQHKEYSSQVNNSSGWDYITLAPHIENEKGLLGAQKAQVLKGFPHENIAGLELGDNSLPEDTIKDRPWLAKGMEHHRQAFFHGSDAYTVYEIGSRHVWLKLASPRIEALRQSFIASDSRIRLGYTRDQTGVLREIENPPDVTVNERPWLKTVVVNGKASFFGSSDDSGSCRFDLSPDLTCIIGGSMTGKSTFLDGLRVYVDAELPQDENVKKQVIERGQHRFLSGSPNVTLECPGRDPTAADHVRWPAVFHTQNELQRLAEEPEAVEAILGRLVKSETQNIQEREKKLQELDSELKRIASQLIDYDEDLADAEQAWERSKQANEELRAFSDAGIEDLHRVSRNLRQWQEYCQAINELEVDLEDSVNTTQLPELPEIDEKTVSDLNTKYNYEFEDVEGFKAEFQVLWERILSHLHSLKKELKSASDISRSVLDTTSACERDVRVSVEQKLADLGLDGSKIKEFQALNQQASLLTSYKANLDDVLHQRNGLEKTFSNLISNRQRIINHQRTAFDRVIDNVQSEFSGRIKVSRIENGGREPLERFLVGLGQRGITRWWNELEDRRRPTPQQLLDGLDKSKLSRVGMSKVVQSTFRESLGKLKKRELAAIRCRDTYVIELAMDDGSYRRLDDLSGGQRVSVLLSLLLETNDERPLVIDQPEDELDNRFLFDTVLPALKRLKGRRQIVVATHNANIVVNGDADQVVQLEATANKGRIAQTGAIEDPAVRDAIVRTVDGGDDAFRLRRLKYGF